MKKKVVVIGAGTIGLHCAYFLRQAGHEVEILETASVNDETGCSYGNCGFVVPSHFTPLASPAMLKSGFKMLFDPQSPVYLPAFSNVGNIPWFLKFIKAANNRQVRKVAPTLYQLNAQSNLLYEEMINKHQADSDYEKQGLLMLSTTNNGFEEEAEVAHIANDLGITTRLFDRESIREIEPDSDFDIAGGVLYESDAHLNPSKHMAWLKKWLSGNGVKFHYNSAVQKFNIKNGKIYSAESETSVFSADEFVIATGAASSKLARLLNMSLPVLAGKGYSIDFPAGQLKLNTPVILTEAKVVITPFVNSFRLGSGMEFNGKVGQVRMNRVQTMLDRTHHAIPSFPKTNVTEQKIWEGLRPVSPDGVPFIGRTQRYLNLLFATGHALMGMSLGPVTGKIITDLISGVKPEFEMDVLHPDRFN